MELNKNDLGLKKKRAIYLSDDEFKKLKLKAEQLFSGKGAVSNFIRKVTNESVIFLDENLKKLAEFFSLTTKKGAV